MSWHAPCNGRGINSTHMKDTLNNSITMKTTLIHVALFLAASLPGAIAAELAGVTLPASINSLHIFGALAASFVLLTFVSDYSSRTSLVRTARAAQPAAGARLTVKAANPLAA